MTRTIRTIALCSAALVAMFGHARGAGADDCGQTLSQCLEDAESFHSFCIMMLCPGGEMLTPGCSVPCQALYQMDTMDCETSYDQCTEPPPEPPPNTGNRSQTCFQTCPDGSISSGACLNNEQAACLCDGRSRGGAVDAFFKCCPLSAPT